MMIKTQVKERPFNAKPHEVQGILAGRQTQFRRPIKLPLAPNHLGQWEPSFMGGKGATDSQGKHVEEFPGIWHTRTGKSFSCPYGVPGDRLWVREIFAIESNFNLACEEDYPPPHKDNRPINRVEEGEYPEYWEQAHYKATDDIPDLCYDDKDEPYCRWKPSIHMPRWASRILLEIVSVRVERVQDISEEDARAEGVKSTAIVNEDGDDYRGHYASDHFNSLWNSINEKRGFGWYVNPWVWVVEFRKVNP